MSNHSREPSLFKAKVEWWVLYFLFTFASIYLAIVLGLTTTGYLLREYIRDNVERNKQERAVVIPKKPEAARPLP